MNADTILDLEHLRGWIGSTEIVHDLLTPRLSEALAATLDVATVKDPSVAPPGVHWCLAVTAAARGRIGTDGHPQRGGFLPPVPLPRRMWAGSEVVFEGVLRVGDEVTRHSRVADVTLKQGRSGPLCFVTVDHVYATPRGTAVRETQNIVYRDAEGGGAPATAPAINAPVADRSWTIEADPVLLFRYSALTFNGHRIHYDRSYCIGEEGYPGLVVHGPLQATILVTLAADHVGRMPTRFSFRGARPLFDGAAFSANLRETEPDAVELWVADAAGATTMAARAEWSSG